jgi:hypothetical protein
MRSFVLGAVGCFAVAGALRAQTDKFTTASSYSLSIPLGDTRHFVTTPSWVGLNWEGAWALARRTSAGVAFSFHDFNDLSSGTTNFPSGEIAPLCRCAISSSRRSWRRVAGIQSPIDHTAPTWAADGVRLLQRDVSARLTQNSRSAIHLAIAPEAGWEFPLMEGIGAFVTAIYAPDVDGHYIGGGPRSFPFATLSFGVVER